jgi:hypothetical protein
MSFRVTPGFKEKLDRAARESGRSLAQEIELRLERSLDEERHLADALEIGFGRQVAGLMLAIGYVIKEAQPGYQPGELGWLSNPEAFRVIAASVNSLLQAIDPDAHPAVWARLRTALYEGDMNAPEFNAVIVAAAIADSNNPHQTEFWPLVPIIDHWLGAAVIARLKDRLALPPATESE